MEHFERNKFIYSGIFPVLFVLLISLIKIIEEHFDLRFIEYGILPRTTEGLKGIILSPLIHGDWTHLFNNSIPLIILGWAMFYFYRSLAIKVIFWSYLLAGLYTWISARSAFHIGASGLVYALFGFLMISGFLRKHIPLIALSFLVAFLYGSLIWGILPWDKTISWEGHFWGLLVGLVLAYFYRKKGPQRKTFVWDEEEDESEIGEYVDFEETKVPNISKQEIVYHFVPKKKDENE